MRDQQKYCQYMPYLTAGYSHRTSNLPVNHQVSRPSMTVSQAACFALPHNLDRATFS
jgi:hypothetical protein